MGILRRLRSTISTEVRLLEELAGVAGRNQALVERLQHHAQLCIYPHMKSELEALAARERAHVKALGAILAEHKMWARPAQSPGRSGSSNWERISGDLELLSEIHAALGRLATEWGGVTPVVSERLAALADEDGEVAEYLRKLSSKLDPQALD